MGQGKKFIYGKDCRTELYKGIQEMYKAVSATLGPHGRTVLIRRAFNTMEPTKDGVTVADEVYSNDEWQGMGMQLVREAAQKANTEAGDSTTTAIVLSHAICEAGLEAVNNRSNVYQLTKGMQKAVDACVDELAKMAVPIEKEEDFKRVATISTQDKEIGNIIAHTFMEAGENGSIDIERNEDPGIIAEKTEGLSFDKGWHENQMAFQYYLNDQKGKRCVQSDIPVLVVDRKIDSADQLMPLLERLADPNTQETIEQRDGWPKGTRKILVISDTFEGSALGLLVANNRPHPENPMERIFHVIYSKAPSYGVHKIEIMKDICALTGATFISEENGGMRVEYADLKHLGRAKKVVIEDKRTIIVGDGTEEQKKRLSERLDLLKAEIADMPKDHIERKELETRLATMTDGISVLKVGSHSENDRNELVRRVDDGVKAVRAAKEEGVTPGCGVGLLKCIPAVEALLQSANTEDERKGMEIVIKALHSLTLRILEVAHVEKFELDEKSRRKIPVEEQRKALVEEMKEGHKKGQNTGYNFEKDELGDMMALGILDAKKAVRIALQAAASCAATFLRVEVAMAEEEEDLLEKMKAKLLQE